MCEYFVELIEGNNFLILFLFHMSHFCLKTRIFEFQKCFFLIKRKKYTYIKKCVNTV